MPVLVRADSLSVPGDRDLYLWTEYALALIAFETDAVLRAAFVDAYIAALGALGAELSWPDASRAVSSVLRILNDARVLSLWAERYPGSARRIRLMWRTRCDPTSLLQVKNAVMLLQLRMFGMDVAVGTPLRKAADSALAAVVGQSYPAVLEAARAYLQAAIRLRAEMTAGKTIGDIDVASRLAAARDLLHEPTGLKGQPQMEAYEDIPDATKDAATNLAQGILSGSDDPVTSETLTEYEGRLKEVKTRLESSQAPQLSVVDRIRSDSNGPILHTEIPADAPVALTAEETRSAVAIRAVLLREMGRKRESLTSSGTVPDTLAVVQRMVTGCDTDVFQCSDSRRGFHAVVLLDLSTSMRGAKFAAATSAVKVMANALQFPFVDFQVLGFAGGETVTRLTQFDPYRASLPPTAARGMTPTHAALAAARVMLQGATGVKRVFLVTDGVPTFTDADGKTMGPELSLPYVKREVERLGQARVHLSTLVVGEEKMELRRLGEALGSTPWEHCYPDTLLIRLQSLILRAFVRDLRWAAL